MPEEEEEEKESPVEQRRRLRSELAEIDRQIGQHEGYGAAASSQARIAGNLEAERARLMKLIDALPDASATPPPDARAAESSSESRAGLTPQHPIAPFAGTSVYVDGLFSLSLGDGDNAFSDSTRSVLRLACELPDSSTTEGNPVIGPASFMVAALDHLLRAAPRSATIPGRDAILNPIERRRVALKGGSTAHAIANGALTQLLADAARLVRDLTPGQVRVDLRHAVLVALGTPAGQEALVSLGLVRGDTGSFRAAIQQIGGLLKDPALGDSEPMFDQVLATLAKSGLLAALAERSAPHYVADAPPLTLTDDRLGVANDARALAEVVCLREPGPPLAVGLFGDWGSGKSTFMNMLEDAIDELVGLARRDTSAAFVKKVVHIRFNAWHYNDANLWASLTSEFFSQLRAGGHKDKGTADYAGLVKSVAESVAALDEATREQGQEALKARHEAARLSTELQVLKSKRQVERAIVLGEVVDEAIVPRGEAEQLAFREAMAALGHPIELPKDAKPEDVQKAIAARAEDVKIEVERAAALPGRALQLGRILGSAISRGWLLAGLSFAIILVAAVAIAVVREPTGAALVHAWVSSVLAGGTLVGCGWAAIRKAYRFVEPIFRLADTYETRLREKRVELESQIIQTAGALEDAQQKQSKAERALADRRVEASRFRGVSPEQVLDHFLNVASATQQFDQQVGIVSQVRRVFDQLDAIFVQRRSLERANENGPLEPQKAGELERLAKLTQGVERIVLYIDDLDRCHVQQVVRVLEATHLLLAFPLFVVVVGIDPRWLRQSLLEVYAGRLRDNALATMAASKVDGATPVAADVPPVGTVQDYLEKIFQVPLRLARLRYDENGSFASYLRSVAGPLQPEAAPTAPLAGAPGATNGAEDGGLPIASTGLREVVLVADPSPEPLRATIERIGLRSAELTFIEALAPLIARSPRAVKRFMNVYRLVRGLHRGATLEQFVCPAEGLPRYPGVAFWLAVDVGLSGGLAPALRKLVRGVAHDGGSLAGLADYIGGVGTPGLASVLRAVSKLLPDPAGTQALDQAFAYSQRFCLQEIDPEAV